MTIRLEAEITRIAGLLPDSVGSMDERRAEALGLLANPLQASRLIAEHTQPDLFTDELADSVEPTATDVCTEGIEESEVHPSLRDRPTSHVDFDQAVFEVAVRRIVQNLDWRRLLPSATVTVYTTSETLRAGHGVCRVPDAGPTLMSTVKEWLGHSQVSLRPVIDLNDRPAPVDRYEIPAAVRDQVLLAQPGSMFPWSNTTHRLDLDHSIPYWDPGRGGPPGQTTVENLAPIARIEHRMITHYGWRRHQPEPGTVIFRSPHGHIYLTNHSGTHDLGTGPFARTIWNAAEPGARAASTA